MSTRQVATSIQAVSPLFGIGAAAAAPASGAGVWASAGSTSTASASAPRPAASPVARRLRDFIGGTPLEFLKVLRASERVCVGFAGADADRAFERHDEDLAVADLPGAGRRGHRLDDARHEIARDRHLDLDLGQEAHGVFGAAVDFGVTLLAAVALDLGHGEAVHP